MGENYDEPYIYTVLCDLLRIKGQIVKFCVCPASKGVRGVTPEIFQNLYAKGEFICILNEFVLSQNFVEIDEKLHYDIFLRAKCPIMRVLCCYES